MAGEVCRLCFEQKFRAIKIFSAKGLKLKVANIIQMHFADEVKYDDDLPKFVCQRCWTKVAHFHKMYKNVLDNRCDFLNNLIQMEETSFTESDDIYDVDAISIKHEAMREMEERETTHENSPEIAGEIAPDYDNLFDSNGAAANGWEISERVADDAALALTTDKEVDNYSEYDDATSIKHIATFSTSDLTCDFCKTTFESLRVARSHYMVQHGMRDGYIKCCKRRLKIRSHIINHIEWHKNPDAFKCQECNKVFASNDRLRRHAAFHESRKFKCEHCDKKFVRKHLLTAHMKRVHSISIKPLQCEICQKTMQSFMSLELHVQAIHMIGDEGGKVCESNLALRLHKQSHDTHSNPNQCTLCRDIPKNERSRQELIHRIQKSGTADCPYCRKVSPNLNALYVHIWNRHNDLARKCHICTREFKSKLALMEHLTTHTGEYLYDCVYCPKRFKLHSSLYQHFRKAHLVEWSADRKTVR